MREEEDRMTSRCSTSTSQSFYSHDNVFENPNVDHHPHIMPNPPPSNLENFIRVEDSFRMPPFTQFQSSSNPEDLRQETPPTAMTPNSVEFEFEENIGGSEFSDEMFFDINEDLDGTTVVPDDEVQVEPPRSGMEFDSEKELIAYYKKYAKQEGFGVRTQRTKRDDEGGSVYVTIGCARGGKYHPKPNSNISKPRPTTKTGCKAKVNGSLNKNEKWVFTTIENSHNHITVSPKKSRLLRSHKHLDQYSQRILELREELIITPNRFWASMS